MVYNICSCTTLIYSDRQPDSEIHQMSGWISHIQERMLRYSTLILKLSIYPSNRRYKAHSIEWHLLMFSNLLGEFCVTTPFHNLHQTARQQISNRQRVTRSQPDSTSTDLKQISKCLTKCQYFIHYYRGSIDSLCLINSLSTWDTRQNYMNPHY